MKRIGYHDILNRKIALESVSDKYINKNCKIYSNRFKHDASKSNARLFISECAKSFETANYYLQEMCNLVENCKDKEISDLFIESVLPKAAVYNINTTDESIKEVVKINQTIDRILENHQQLSKKVDFDLFVKECGKMISNEILINKCCEAISDANIKTRGKVLIALEEFNLLAGKYNIPFDENYINETAISYFMIREGADAINIPALYNGFINSLILEYDDYYETNENIEIFKMSAQKTDDALIDIIEDIFLMDNYKVPRDLEKLFNLLREIMISSNDELLCSGVYSTVLPSIYESFYKEKIDDSDAKLLADRIITIISDEIEFVNQYISKFDNEIVISHLTHYLSAMKILLGKFIDVQDIVYTQYNIESMNIKLSENSSTVSLDEYKVFKFENLITATYKADKYLAKKCKEVRDNEIKKIKDKIFDEATVYDTIHEDGKIDYKICTLETLSEISSRIQDIVTGYCKDINESIINDSEFRCYYIVESSNIIDIHITGDDMVELTTEEKEQLLSIVDKDEEDIISYFGNINDSFDKLCVPIMKDAETYFCNTKDEELFGTFIDACSLAGVEKESISSLFEAVSNSFENSRDFYMTYCYNIENYKITNSDISIQMEAMNLISNMIYEDFQDQKNKVKNAFAGINLNSIQLFLQGLKKKVKDLNSQEKQLSRNIDVTFNNFVNSIKKTLVSDRREAIIKGSVIPSFSKAIKLAVLAAGTYIINPAAGVIATIGALAVSKNLTKKERTLLLDDISVELEMIDKEINIAESRNQMKKLRALLRTKKELERQYQRIKYNIRVGGDLIPSSVGTQKGD